MKQLIAICLLIMLGSVSFGNVKGIKGMPYRGGSRFRNTFGEFEVVQTIAYQGTFLQTEISEIRSASGQVVLLFRGVNTAFAVQIK